jgi:hypothetical protein
LPKAFPDVVYKLKRLLALNVKHIFLCFIFIFAKKENSCLEVLLDSWHGMVGQFGISSKLKRVKSNFRNLQKK